MNIGDAAQATGLPVKTIRYYEEIGLVAARRAGNGYRAYDEAGIQKLRFVQRARRLGFSVEDCRTLLSLYEETGRESAEVKAVAQKHLAEIDTRIRELRGLRGTLAHLIDHCAGDSRPDCPILDDLAGG
jgi:MerR family transcriptional regulator, copper efflux regulator